MTSARNGAAATAAPPARLDLYSVALNLARQAADKRRPRRTPLSRRQALAEAPWIERFRESGCGEREWRAAYADRLIERGIAEPSSSGRRSGPSGSSGRHQTPRIRISASEERIARWQRAARAAGVSLAVWLGELADRESAVTGRF